VGDTNTALEATLQFAVAANTNNVSRIELFGTGGSLGSVVNQSSATFAVAASYLGIGLHLFYAVVTTGSGAQYRTETRWMRIVGAESPFLLSLKSPPPSLSWPASAGRGYDVLTSTNPGGAMQVTASITPTNSTAVWTDTNPAAPQRFYRVRTSD
jgi:hypothetical protein